MDHLELHLLLQDDSADPAPGQSVTTAAGPAAALAGVGAAGNQAGTVVVDEELRPATGTPAQACTPSQAKPAKKRNKGRSLPVESGTTSGSQQDADVTVCHVCCCCQGIKLVVVLYPAGHCCCVYDGKLIGHRVRYGCCCHRRLLSFSYCVKAW